MTIFSRMLKEWQVLLLSLSIFTRLPIPRSIPKSKNEVIESYKYSGVAGLLIGAFAALMYLFIGYYLSDYYAIYLALIISFVGARLYQGSGFIPKSNLIISNKKMKLRTQAKRQAVMFTVLMVLFLIKYMVLLRVNSVPHAMVIGHFLSYSMVFSIIYKYSYSDQKKEWVKGVSISSERQDDIIVLMFIVLAVSCLISNSKLSFLLLLVSFFVSRGFFLLMDKHAFIKVTYAINIVQSITEILCYITFYVVVGS